MFFERQTQMATLYSRLKIRLSRETKIIGLFMLLTVGFSVWLPYYFAQLTLAGAGMVP